MDREPRVAKAVATAAVLAVTAAAYGRALGAAFQFDDLVSVHRNAKLQGLGRFLRVHFLADWASGGRPVTELTFALDHALAGWSSFQFHLTGVLLHLAAIAALLGLTLRVLGRAGVARPFPWSLAIVAIWGLHPVQTESVTYVAQRAEVLAALFTVASVYLLLWAEERFGTPRGTLAYAGALVTFAVGFGAKATTIVVPALFLLWAVCFPDPGDRGRRRRRVAVLVLPFVAFALMGGIRLLGSFRGMADVGFDIPGVTVARYALTQTRVVLLYLRLLFWPVGQVVDWDVRLSTGIGSSSATSTLALMVVIGGAVWLLLSAQNAGEEEARSRRLIAFGVGWFLVTLTPTSSIVPLADLMFEHRVYLASWGIALAVVALARLAVERVPAPWVRPGIVGAGALVVVALATATHVRNAVWRTNESLWRDAVEKSPRKARPHLNLGQALWERGETAAALQSYLRGLGLDVGTLSPGQIAVAYGNVSAALGGMGLHREAIEAALKGLRLIPGSPQLLSNLAHEYRAVGDRENARHWAQRALAVASGLAEPHVTLGLVHLDEGDLQGALREFRIATAVAPESESAAMAMAVVFEARRDVRQACEWWARTGRLARAPRERAIAAQHLQALGCGGP